MENKKILLVEDNENDVALTKRALKKANIQNELVVAADGVEALGYFFGKDGNGGCNTADLPVVVLLDLNLPRINGLEVLKRLHAEVKTRSVPIVVLTSSNEESDIVTSYHLGANSFIRKPVSFDDFTEAIKLLGLYWLVVNQAAPSGLN